MICVPFARPQKCKFHHLKFLGIYSAIFFELTDRSLQDLKVCGVDHEKSKKKSSRQYLTLTTCHHSVEQGWWGCWGTPGAVMLHSRAEHPLPFPLPDGAQRPDRTET